MKDSNVARTRASTRNQEQESLSPLTTPPTSSPENVPNASTSPAPATVVTAVTEKDPSLSSSSDSDLDTPLITHKMSSSDIATITRSQNHKSAPTLNAGKITIEVLKAWEVACIDYFDNAKEKPAEAVKVSRVLTGLVNPRVNTWINMNRDRLKAMTFKVFMMELRKRFLDTEWEKDLRRKILGCRMPSQAIFYDWAEQVLDWNSLLVTPELKLTEEALKAQLDAGMSKDLSVKCAASGTVKEKDDLFDWLQAVKIVDEDMRREDARIDARWASKRPLLVDSRKPNVDAKKPRRDEGSPQKQRWHSLSLEERDVLRRYAGCFKCRRLYAGHLQHECDDLPIHNEIITEDMGKEAKAAQ
jgi:hypothetical protein